MRMVVDASVARSAGLGRPDAGPPSPQAVAALDAVRDGGHQVVSSPALEQEWDRHARDYALRWLGNMVARKRYVYIRDTWAEEAALLERAADLAPSKREAVAKDVHLVGLAMLTDRRVLSLDDQQARLLQDLPDLPRQVHALHWVSPRDPRAVPWLLEGAHDAPTLCLGALQDSRQDR